MPKTSSEDNLAKSERKVIFEQRPLAFKCPSRSTVDVGNSLSFPPGELAGQDGQ